MWIHNFLVIIFFAQYSLGANLSCTFALHFDGYNCEMDSIFTQPSTVPEYLKSGNHRLGRGDSDVKVFFVTATSLTQYLPSKVCTFFKHISKFDIFGKLIVEIKRNVFEGCMQTKKVMLRHVTFKTFDSDLLSDLINLESFNLESTSIDTIPHNFFQFNRKLLELNMAGNRLRFINAEIPKTVSVLILSNNDCIDTSSRRNGIQLVIDEINEKCKDNSTFVALPMETPTQQRIQILENSVIEYFEKFGEVETDFENKQEEVKSKVNALTQQLITASDNLAYINQNELSKNLTDINNTFNKLQKNVQKIHDKSLEINLRVEKSSALRVENEKLRSSVSRSHHLVIIMLAVQTIVMLYIFGVVGYVKFYVGKPRCIVRHTSNITQGNGGLMDEQLIEDDDN